MTILVPAPGQSVTCSAGRSMSGSKLTPARGRFGASGMTGLWDTNRWGAEDPDWVDFTPYVLAVSIRQGAERWGERVETGTATVTVDNTTGIFTPDRGAGPLVPYFPSGPADADRRYPRHGDGCEGASVHRTARCGHWGMWPTAATTSPPSFSCMISWGIGPPTTRSKPLIPATSGPTCESMQHSTGTDGRPTRRDIQTGDHNVQGSTLSDTTLEECQTAADAEGGIFYCSKDGLATFKSEGLADHRHPLDRHPRAMSATPKCLLERRRPISHSVSPLLGSWPG